MSILPKYDPYSEIIDGLFLGARSAPENKETVQKLKITHVLSVDSKPLQEKFPGIVYAFIKADDEPFTDLLSRFEETYKFIESAISSGDSRCYLHCHAGVSRSATVAVAYLMKKRSWSFQKALAAILPYRAVSPNQGFVDQLRLYEVMGWQIQPENVHYHFLKMVSMYTSFQREGLDVVETAVNALLEKPVTVREGSTKFKCKTCRKLLFTSDDCLPHWRSEQPTYLWEQYVRPCPPYQDTSCSNGHFIQLLVWMKTDVTAVDGKLLCPKCQTKVGKFNIHGVGCSCGAQITPGFWINESKVDKLQPSLFERLLQKV